MDRIFKIVCLLLPIHNIGANNFGTSAATYINPTSTYNETTHFGYSMSSPIYDSVSKDFSILIGAPTFTKNNEKGLIYKVSANIGTNKIRSSPTSLFTAQYDATEKNAVVRNDSALGLNIASKQNRVSTCAPLMYRQCKDDTRIVSGACFQSANHGTEWNDQPKPAVQDCPTDAVDLIFVLDGSFSVGLSNFGLVKQWVVDLSRSFDIANDDHIGVIQYSHWYEFRSDDNQAYLRTEISLGEYKDQVLFTNAVRVIPLHGFTTYTAHAINKTVRDFQSSSRFNDPEVAKVMILLTDGNADDFTELQGASNYARSLGIKTIAVGVGDIKHGQLQVIGNGEIGNDENVFTVTDFAGLQDIIEILKTSIASRLEGGERVNNLEYSEIGISGEFSKVKERNKILKMKPEDLILAAQQGKLDPKKILQAYMYKACYDTQELNSITCIIKECYEVAAKLSDNEEKGLLYGLPVSLKECIKIKGTDATIGISKLIDVKAAEDAVIARVLKHCGAVPYVKTNVVQLMLSFEGSNPIYGESHNPHNMRLTTGGSSSGEGAIVGSGGSPLGFGTDIAGSIRVPAHMCGIAGLKPTMNRISKKGIQSSLPSQTLLCSTVGPMAKDVDTLVVAMTALLCPMMFQLDLDVPPLPFNEEIYLSKRKLRIGYYDDDGYNKPIPAIQRALHIAKDALESAGHTLVKFPVPNVAEAMRISSAAVYADGGKGIIRLMKDEKVDIRGKDQYRKWIISPFFRTLKYYFKWLRYPRIAEDDFFYGGGNGSVDRLWGLVALAKAYKKQFCDLWNSHELDALICPPFPVVACEKGSISNMTALMSYSTLYTLLNYSAGVVPVTKVTSADIKGLDDYKGHYGDPWDKNIKTACKGAEGMPVAVQCVAPTWQDEMCLRVMKEVESIVQYS